VLEWHLHVRQKAEETTRIAQLPFAAP